MSPLLPGIIASGISGHLTPPWSPEGAYDALSTVTLSSATNTVSFSGIPSGYKHLQLRISALGDTSTAYDVIMRLNSDSGTNYNWHRFYGNGSSVSAGNSTSSNMYIAGDGARTNYPLASVVDILDYNNSQKNKVAKIFTGWDHNGSGVITLWSGLWRNTSPITSINISVVISNFAAGSTFSLYGVK